MYATTSAVMRRRRPVLRIVRLFRIDGRQAVADARQGLDQPGFERRVDAAPQFVDVRTQHVAVRRVVAPQRVFEPRSEEHTSELQSLMRISYAVFCLKKKRTTHRTSR